MSGKPVTKDLKEILKLGKKYNPFFKIDIEREIRKFDEQIKQILVNITKPGM